MNRYCVLSLLTMIGLNAINEKPIVVVIPSYNNEQWYERNLNSVCFQNYENYRIVYIDDCSPDGTGNLVQSYINKHNMSNKVTLIKNKINRGALYNLYTAIHECADDEIIVTVDGDDWLKHKDVLKRVNREYQNPNVWMTYGQFESYPKGTRGFCRDIQKIVVQKNAYREVDWVTSHLRTFYAGLFKQIKLKDLVHEGELFRVTWDMAFLFPMLEMANGKFSFIPDVLYVYNEDTPLNDFKLRVLKQLRCNKIIHGKDKYAPIESYMTMHRGQDNVDLVIFAQDVGALDTMLTKVQTDTWPIHAITVLVDTRIIDYADIEKKFDYVDFVFFGKGRSLADCVHEICAEDGYILWTTDNVYIDEVLPLPEAIKALKQTKALSCNFALDQQVKRTTCLNRQLKTPTLTHLSSTHLSSNFCATQFIATHFCAWQFIDGEFEWREPFACTMTLYKKSDIHALLQDAQFQTLAEMQSILQRSNIDPHQMGICPQQSMVHFDENVQSVPAFLEPLLQAGYKKTGMSLIKG